QNAADEMRVTVVATGLTSEASPRLAAVKRASEGRTLPGTPVLPGAEALPAGMSDAQVAQAPLLGRKEAYDEDTLQVPTWIRRQAD
ncbi:MAG: hypothetical protein Q9M27_02255, partial [Mariprofundaceae bacterium]|nr:hypothetical protein [Mariprofundaceae bacterium]